MRNQCQRRSCVLIQFLQTFLWHRVLLLFLRITLISTFCPSITGLNLYSPKPDADSSADVYFGSVPSLCFRSAAISSTALSSSARILLRAMSLMRDQSPSYSPSTLALARSSDFNGALSAATLCGAATSLMRSLFTVSGFKLFVFTSTCLCCPTGIAGWVTPIANNFAGQKFGIFQVP